jgi:hypothetical protein
MLAGMRAILSLKLPRLALASLSPLSPSEGGYKYIRDRLAQFSTQWGGKNNTIVAEFFKPCALLEKKAQ